MSNFYSKHPLFDFFAFGDAIGYLPYFVYAFQLMGQRGLGQLRIAYRLSRVWDGLEKQLVYDQHGHFNPNKVNIVTVCQWAMTAKGRKVKADQADVMDLNGAQRYRMVFETPACFMQNGHALTELTEEYLLKSLKLRYRLMHELFGHFHPDDYNVGADWVIAQQRLHLHRWQRYSNRQNRQHQQMGILGHLTLENVTPRSRLFLLVMQQLHIGKNTTFGLGKFSLEPL